MMRNIDAWIAPEQTPERVARHEAWVQEYEDAICKHWEDSGEDVDSEHGRNARAFIVEQMRVTSRPQWMTPGEAIAELVAHSDTEELSPQHRIDLADAMRTRAAISDKEWLALVAEAMGICAESVARYLPASPDKGRTAVYRHIRPDGTLLYVGITDNLARRWAQHLALSPWADGSVRVTAHWVETRAEAKALEAEAIGGELPLHNVQFIPHQELMKRDGTWDDALT